jgi:hypothetical protein
MSEYEQTVNDLRRYGASGLVVGIVGLVLCAVGFMANRALFYQSWLYALIVWSSITVGCLSVLCLQNSIRAQWGSAIQRFLEAGARMLPFVALLFLPIFLGGMRYLYPWASNGAAASQMAHSKLIYLRMPWFAVRWGIYFLIWSFLAYRLSSWSYQQDVSGDPRLSQKRANLGAPGMMIMLITVTLSMTDWVMSLYPGWDSTIFGFLFTVGQALGGASLMTVIVMALSGSAPWSKIMSERITKDLGNVLLTLVILWAYASFSQYLLIWSANLPEEISFYVTRARGGWWWMANALIFLQFFVPFFLLLSSKLKRTASMLGFTAGVILFMRMVDIFWIVMPAFRSMRFSMQWTDLAALMAIGGFWAAGLFYQAASRPLLPLYDPRVAAVMPESI